MKETSSMAIREYFALAAFIIAALFALAGLIGLFRFPGPFARLQAGSLCGTTAVFTSFIGALILAPSWAFAGRILLIMLLFMINAPVGSYIVARFSWQSGVPVWKPGKTFKKRAAEKRGKRPGESRKEER